MTCWVVDTSPLIFLAKLDRLDLLRNGADEILVPPAVVREIQMHPDDASRKIEAALSSWLTVRPVADHGALEMLLAELDAGEAEAIALAREVKADRVVVDESDGRRLARRLDLVAVGTLGLLLAAKKRGDLSSLQAEIERLQANGFRVSKTLVEGVLQEAGEDTESAPSLDPPNLLPEQQQSVTMTSADLLPPQIRRSGVLPDMEDERLSFDFEDLDLLDRDALLDEAAEVAGSLVSRLVRDRSYGPETDVLGVIADLKAEKAAFGPSPEVLPLDAESLAARGVVLDARVKALLERFDFYAVTFPVILFPRRGWAFNRLECQVELNPGEPSKRRPLAHDIFPSSSWETLANATMRLEIGITEGLKLGTKAVLPPFAEATAEAKLDAGAGFAFPLREYSVRRARIVSRGKDDCEVFWRLDDTRLFEQDDLPLGVILKVPRGVTPVRAKGVLVADRSFQTLSADLGNLMSHLSERVRSFFRKGAPLRDSKEWELVG